MRSRPTPIGQVRIVNNPLHLSASCELANSLLKAKEDEAALGGI